MDEDEIEALERAMAEAALAEDFEAAARLRDRIAALRAQGGAGQESAKHSESLFRRQVPGRMGLGTDQQVFAPPEGWKPPSKPDLFTANTKPRGGKR